MGVIERRRHQLRRLAAGVAEHDALVARALVLVAGGVDALGDVGGLRVQQHLDLGVAPVEAVLLVADVLDRLARAVSTICSVGSLGPRTSPAMTTRLVVASVSQATRIWYGSIPALRALAEEQIDDLVGDPVADLVGMPFGHGLHS